MLVLPNDYPTEENFLAVKKEIETSNRTLKKLEAEADGVELKSSDSISTSAGHNIDILSDKSMASYVVSLTRYGTAAAKIADITLSMNTAMNFCSKYINENIAQVLIKDIEKTALNSKKVVNEITLKSAKSTKAMLVGCTQGKASGSMSVILMPILLKYQILSTILTLVVTLINALMEAIPGIIAVEAESMALFFTPKSMQKLDIKAINTNMSIVDRLPDPIKLIIINAIKAIDFINIPLKKAIITTSAERGRAAAAADNNDFVVKNCSTIELLDHKKIVDAIEFIVSLIPIPQGLPKYERLSLLNFGFDAFLLTSFEPAGRQAFGMPGQP